MCVCFQTCIVWSPFKRKRAVGTEGALENSLENGRPTADDEIHSIKQDRSSTAPGGAVLNQSREGRFVVCDLREWEKIRRDVRQSVYDEWNVYVRNLYTRRPRGPPEMALAIIC